MLKETGTILFAALLSGCALTTPNAIAAAYATYDTAVSAEIAYKATGKADPVTLAKVEALRVPAWNALHAAETVAAAGGKPDMVAVTAALSGLTAYETSHSIK